MNYYEVLGVKSSDSLRTIRKHYYHLAKQCHPDKANGKDKANGNSIGDEDFKRLSEIYSTLSNPRKRYLYDINLAIRTVFDILGLPESTHPIHFEDFELEILHQYYTKITQSSEFKFVRLVTQSLPSQSERDLKTLFRRTIEFLKRRSNETNETNETSTSSPDYRLVVPHHKTIDCFHLTEDYSIHLKRPFDEVYQTTCKEVLVFATTGIYRIFITHSDYTISLPTNNQTLYIHIETDPPPHISIHGYDLYLEYPVNLYQQMFATTVSLVLPSRRAHQARLHQTSLPHQGLRNHFGERGTLYLVPYKCQPMDMRIAHIHQELLQTIFDISINES
jgi:curved DNA-binding protein CbpA